MSFLSIFSRSRTESKPAVQTYEQLVSSHVAMTIAKLLPPMPQSGSLKKEGINETQSLINGITKQYLDIFPESSHIPISPQRVGAEVVKYMIKFQQELESRLIVEGPMKIDALRVEVIKLIRGSKIDEITIVRAVNVVEDRPGTDESKILFYTTLGNELRSSRNVIHKSILKNIQNRFPSISF